MTKQIIHDMDSGRDARATYAPSIEDLEPIAIDPLP
jgi:hypothetical protein